MNWLLVSHDLGKNQHITVTWELEFPAKWNKKNLCGLELKNFPSSGMSEINYMRTGNGVYFL